MKQEEYDNTIEHLNKCESFLCHKCNSFHTKCIFIEEEKQYIYRCEKCHKEYIIDIPMSQDIQINGVSDERLVF